MSSRPAATTTGASVPSSSGTTTEWSRRAISVPMVVSAVKGTSPVTASTITSASEYTSLRPSSVSPRACSGEA